jgi:hypothetical protein
MNRILVVLLLTMCVLTSLAGAQYHISGTVRDAASNEPLASAHVRILGSNRGSIANAYGEYSLALDRRTFVLIFSSLGYRPDTLLVNLTSDTLRDIYLTAADITLPEIVVTAEDPAIEIIRRAIASKRLWIDKLNSYTFDAFTRQTLFRDTIIASITESYTRGYWRQGDTLRESITQRRQTQNIQATFNFASVGRILNFNDDEIRFAGYTFIGPTAPNALDYYDYTLLRTRTDHGRELYEIRMVPQTRTVPLFNGTVTIAGETYALAGIDVQPNEAFLIPFVKEKSLRYRQQFGLFNDIFWMPVDIRIEASLKIGIIGFSIPGIGLHQTSVITSYTINTIIPDTIFHRQRLVVDSSATKTDSTFWINNTVLPLSEREREAYKTLDSTKTLDVQFRPGGAAMTLGLGGETGTALSLISFLDVTFNRVEGLHLGVQKELDSLLTTITFTGGAAYGFTDRQWKYRTGVTAYTSPSRRYGLSIELYRQTAHVPDQGYYSSPVVGLGALLSKIDYWDYFSAKGWRTTLIGKLSDGVVTRYSFLDEHHFNQRKRTDFSLLYPSRSYRANLEIDEGRLRSIEVFIRLGGDPIPLDLITRDALEVTLEHSTPLIASSDFLFTRYNVVATLTFPTFGRSYLFPQTMRIRLAAGGSSGTLPSQRFFSVEASLSGFAPFGTMRSLDAREMTGTSMVALNIEHNFRSVPFLALGIPFLYENNIEMIVHAGAARVWGPPMSATADSWFRESGVSINRIFELLRADFTWRLSSPHNFVFTIGVAQIL